MTLMCIDRSQSPTHKSSFLQGRKSPVNSSSNSNNNNNNNNINQQHNANNNNNNNQSQSRRNSCSPPLSNKAQQQDAINKSQQNNLESSRKLERSTSEPVDRRASVQTNSSRYKTELCRPYEENGTCKYGDKCQFAHGQKELRSMARHPKYKTELCRTFHSTGLCPYGPRCHFIHNSDQFKKSLLSNLTVGTVTVSNTTPPPSRQKPLTSLGSAGDISPPSSHGGSPTGMKSFDDLYKQPPLSPVSIAQSLVNLNHPNFDFAPVDCFSDAFGFIADGALVNGVGDPSLDNYGYIGGFISEYSPVTPASEEGLYLRLPIFNRIQSKQ